MECGNVTIRSVKSKENGCYKTRGFEMLVWKKREKVKLTDRLTSVEVLNLVKAPK